jgi:hypothetical protein
MHIPVFYRLITVNVYNSSFKENFRLQKVRLSGIVFCLAFTCHLKPGHDLFMPLSGRFAAICSFKGLTSGLNHCKIIPLR